MTTEARLNEAVRALAAALAALSADPAGASVDVAIERTELLLDQLEPGLTTIVLHRLLASISDCHRCGLRTSVQLRTRRASAARALHLDPHRQHTTARKAS